MYYMDDEFFILRTSFVYDSIEFARYLCISNSNKEYSVLSNDNFTIDNVLFYLKLHVSKALAEELYTIRPNYWVSIIELT